VLTDSLPTNRLLGSDPGHGADSFTQIACEGWLSVTSLAEGPVWQASYRKPRFFRHIDERFGLRSPIEVETFGGVAPTRYLIPTKTQGKPKQSCNRVVKAPGTGMVSPSVLTLPRLAAAKQSSPRRPQPYCRHPLLKPDVGPLR
jgi:hypothetical protein